MKKPFAFICTLFVAFSLLIVSSSTVQADVLTVENDNSVVESRTLSVQSSPNSYDMIKSALLAGKTEGRFDISELPYQEVGTLIQQIVNDNPEIMYYYGGDIWSDGKIVFNYSVPLPVVRTNQKVLQAEVNNVLSSIIKPGSSDFDKVKAIHDYLALNTAYDFDNFNNDNIPPDSYTAFGALVKGSAVCDGYTKAAQLLLDRLGIENYYVDGTSNGELHSWNLVKLNGNYYFMDITWDDPVPDTPNSVRYTYFLVTSDQLRKDHSWLEAKWPKATSTTYNYFNDFNNMIEVGDDYFYSSNTDNGKLYKVAKNGTEKQKVNDVHTPYFAISGDWIYFSNYSYDGYLHKMKKDGSKLEKLNAVHSTDITIKGTVLTYLNNITNQKETVILDTPVIPNGKIVGADKMWTVTFNTKIDKTSISNKTVVVTSEDGKPVNVTFGFDSTATKVLVHAPLAGYTVNTNYVLTIKNVKSHLGIVQKKEEIHLFYVK